MQKLSGPIPGENYTSDTKNYPWHRPPEHTDLDKAIDAIAKKLLSEDAAIGLLSMVQAGTDIATLTDTFLTSGIGAGKWTPDFAILLAGPTSHIMCLMCKGYGIKYDLGLDEKKTPYTKAYFEAIKVDKKKIDTIKKNIPIEEVKEHFEAVMPQPTGFMGMAQQPPMMPQEGMMEEQAEGEMM